MYAASPRLLESLFGISNNLVKLKTKGDVFLSQRYLTFATMPIASLFNRPKADPVGGMADRKAQDALNKEVGVTTDEAGSGSESESISTDAQAGVQAIEATTSVWSKRDLILAYIL